MDNSTYVSISLAQTMLRDLDVTANNIANANTAGFKGEHLAFESYMHEADDDEAGEISFVVDVGSYTDVAQGPLTETGNPLDVALMGDGWFAYRTTDGQTGYGRDGRFTVDVQGNLSLLNGARVLDAGGGEIGIPPDAGELTIARDGTISSAVGGPIAQIGVFALPDVQAMERVGSGMLVRAAGAPAVDLVEPGQSEVVQGAIERSNVQPVTEITRLMEIQRAYERAVNLLNGEDELRRDTLQRLGRDV